MTSKLKIHMVERDEKTLSFEYEFSFKMKNEGISLYVLPKRSRASVM